MDVSELLARYQAGERDFHNFVVIKADFTGANLSGANLSGADLWEAHLAGADLSGVNLCRSDLGGANLEDANLEGANLSGAILNGANLEGASFFKANLSRVNLSEVNLSKVKSFNFRKANFSGAELEDANLRRADFSGANLSGANLSGADLEGATLSGANLDGADLIKADFTGANLSGANLSGAELEDADLSGANLSGANLSGADFENANLSGANLSGADLEGAILSGAILIKTNLSNAKLWKTDLTGANLTDANLTDAKLSEAKLDGTIPSKDKIIIPYTMPKHVKPIQRIIFGSPGTGKSYKIREIATQQLKINFDEATKMLSNTVKTVFHPEYTYADFMGKLLPLTQGTSIIYKFYPGHFLRILGMAYRSLIENKQEHYLLVIDELNRGNAAAIFGTVFQLLDRESDGWSSYEVDVSEMELVGILQTMHIESNVEDGRIEIKEGHVKTNYEHFCQKKADDLLTNNFTGARVFNLLKQRRISIPNNLSIIATINTSDESIYYLDSAFKRRWDWEYVNAPIGELDEKSVPESLRNVYFVINDEKINFWYYYIVGINEFIKSNSHVIRRVEDKQIGWWFIKPENDKVELSQVRDKLMFYLWDSVFARDKRPLEEFLFDRNEKIKLLLYSDFIDLAPKFMSKICVRGFYQFDHTATNDE